ncbi:MAG: hypothetical protein RR450_07335 [Oscillospiraceae bacterium]
MNEKQKVQQRPWFKPLMFALVGGLLGFLYYLTIGCASGTCAIASSPLYATLYGGVIGYLLSHVFTKSK